MVSIDFVDHLKPERVEFFNCIFKQVCVSEEVTLLSNSISRNFPKIMLCLRDEMLCYALKGHN